MIRAVAGAMTALTLSAFAQPYAPGQCRALDGTIGDLIRAEGARTGAVQQIYDRILPFSRPATDIPGLDAAHIMVTTELFAAIQQQHKLIAALEDYQHQLRLCARRQ